MFPRTFTTDVGFHKLGSNSINLSILPIYQSILPIYQSIINYIFVVYYHHQTTNPTSDVTLPLYLSAATSAITTTMGQNIVKVNLEISGKVN